MSDETALFGPGGSERPAGPQRARELAALAERAARAGGELLGARFGGPPRASAPSPAAPTW